MIDEVAIIMFENTVILGIVTLDQINNTIEMLCKSGYKRDELTVLNYTLNKFKLLEKIRLVSPAEILEEKED